MMPAYTYGLLHALLRYTILIPKDAPIGRGDRGDGVERLRSVYR